MPDLTAQHVYHHNDSDGLRVNMSIEKNSRGYNYSVTVVGAKTVEEGLAVIKEAEEKLKEEYGISVEGKGA
jgi:hypothetical protein